MWTLDKVRWNLNWVSIHPNYRLTLWVLLRSNLVWLAFFPELINILSPVRCERWLHWLHLAWPIFQLRQRSSSSSSSAAQLGLAGPCLGLAVLESSHTETPLSVPTTQSFSPREGIAIFSSAKVLTESKKRSKKVSHFKSTCPSPPSLYGLVDFQTFAEENLMKSSPTVWQSSHQLPYRPSEGTICRAIFNEFLRHT